MEGNLAHVGRRLEEQALPYRQPDRKRWLFRQWVQAGPIPVSVYFNRMTCGAAAALGRRNESNDLWSGSRFGRRYVDQMGQSL
jgi:hypothetical protein